MAAKLELVKGWMNLKKIFSASSCIQDVTPSLVSIGLLDSEEKIFEKVYDVRQTDAK
jgi:hypothetical protein